MDVVEAGRFWMRYTGGATMVWKRCRALITPGPEQSIAVIMAVHRRTITVERSRGFRPKGGR